MKTILYVVVLLITCGAGYYSYDLSQKFEALEKVRVVTIATNKQVTANADANDTKIKKERELLAQSKERRDLLTQSVSSLTSVGAGLTNDSAKLDDDLKAQDLEFAQLNKTIEEVNAILAQLGGGVTLDTLPEKIQQVEDDKKAKQKKLEELEAVAAGAEKSLATSRAESDRLTKKMIERGSRISRNAMEAVITAVNQDWGFVVIGAGSNSGFTPQTALLVQRDGRNIAKLHPSSIEPTQTIAEIDLQSLASGVRLQPGDRAILATPTSN